MFDFWKRKKPIVDPVEVEKAPSYKPEPIAQLVSWLLENYPFDFVLDLSNDPDYERIHCAPISVRGFSIFLKKTMTIFSGFEDVYPGLYLETPFGIHRFSFSDGRYVRQAVLDWKSRGTGKYIWKTGEQIVSL